jgi:hypothetical protein
MNALTYNSNLDYPLNRLTSMPPARMRDVQEKNADYKTKTTFYTRFGDRKFKSEQQEREQKQLDYQEFSHVDSLLSPIDCPRYTDVHRENNAHDLLVLKNQLTIDRDNFIASGNEQALKQHFGIKPEAPKIQEQTSIFPKPTDLKQLTDAINKNTILQARVYNKNTIDSGKNGDDLNKPVVPVDKNISILEESKEQLIPEYNPPKHISREEVEKLTTDKLREILGIKGKNLKKSELVDRVIKKWSGESEHKGETGHGVRNVIRPREESRLLKTILQAEKKSGLVPISHRHIIR